MDNVISFNGGVPLGSQEETTVNPEVTDIVLPQNNAWLAAATAAVVDRAVWGVLLFVNDEGDFIRIPVCADMISLRGILEVALDDLKLE